MKKENESKNVYLKTIYLLGLSGKPVRNIDISRALGYSKPSVTNALKKLIDDGSVVVGQNKDVLLTNSGLSIAKSLML